MVPSKTSPLPYTPSSRTTSEPLPCLYTPRSRIVWFQVRHLPFLYMPRSRTVSEPLPLYVVPTSPRSSIPEVDLRHRTLVPDSGSEPHKGGLGCTYERIGQSSNIGTIDPDVGDRHQTSAIEGEIRHRWYERYSGPRKVDPRVILSYQLKHQTRGKPKSRGIHARGVYSAYRRDT